MTNHKTSIFSPAILFLLILGALVLQSFSMNRSTDGEALFLKHCARCHGADGTRGLFGAKNLKTSTLSDELIANQINKGKGFMPSFKKKFSPEELTQLVGYVKTLRKH